MAQNTGEKLVLKLFCGLDVIIIQMGSRFYVTTATAPSNIVVDVRIKNKFNLAIFNVNYLLFKYNIAPSSTQGFRLC